MAAEPLTVRHMTGGALASSFEEPAPCDLPAGQAVGFCSKCGDARDDFYTCRDGGYTLAPGGGNPGPASSPKQGSE